MDTKPTVPAMQHAQLLEAPDVDDLLNGLPVKQALAFESLSRGDSVAKVARTAGIARNTIYNWLEAGTEFARVYDRWKRTIAETSRTRLLLAGEAATVQIAKAIGEGDTRAALAVAKGMGLLSPPPVGPSLAETRAQIEEAKTPTATRAREFQDLISGLTDPGELDNYNDNATEALDEDELEADIDDDVDEEPSARQGGI